MGQGFLRRGRRVVVAEVVADARPLAADAERPESAPGAPPRVPRAIYRFHLQRGFGLEEVAGLVPYLASLGVSHVCCSPVLRTDQGREIGPDVPDDAAVEPGVGGQRALETLFAVLRAFGMGQILEFTPDQMTHVSADHTWWLDVLENGRASRYADCFDVEWEASRTTVGPARVWVPSARAHGAVRDALGFDAVTGSFFIVNGERRLPLWPGSYGGLLRAVLDRSCEELSRTGAASLATVASAFGRVADDLVTSPGRRGDTEGLKRRLAEIVRADESVCAAITELVRGLNDGGQVPGIGGLSALLDGQAFRLVDPAESAVGAELRIEHDTVFRSTHRPLLEWTEKGWVDGVRVMNVDNISDPGAYLQRLQAGVSGVTSCQEAGRPTPYLVVDKGASPRDALPKAWPVDGTTGHRSGAIVDGVLIDSAASERFGQLYEGYTGRAAPFAEVARESRGQVLDGPLLTQLRGEAGRLSRLAAAAGVGLCDVATMWRVLRGVLSCLPVTRAYGIDGTSAREATLTGEAIDLARAREPELPDEAVEFVRRVMTLDASLAELGLSRDRVRTAFLGVHRLAARIVAAGGEDTARSRDVRLVSLSAPGTDPSEFGIAVSAFHASHRHRAERWPHGVVATSSQGAPLGPDVRARINCLSEMPDAWQASLLRWSAMNAGKKSSGARGEAPSAADEYLLYQAMIGSWQEQHNPERYQSRLVGYMIRAIRSAGLNSSHDAVDRDYERAVEAFVAAVLEPSADNAFLPDFAEAHRFLAWLGLLNTVAMTAMKLTVPGVPHFFQGSEVLDLSLDRVDREAAPIDWEQRRVLAKRLRTLLHKHPDFRESSLVTMLAESAGDALKAYLVCALLACRARHPELFERGGYRAITASGRRARHVIAYAREREGEGIVVVAGRLFGALCPGPGAIPCGPEVWSDTAIDLHPLPDGAVVTDVLTGHTRTLPDPVSNGGLPVGELLRQFPVSILEYSVPAA